MGKTVGTLHRAEVRAVTREQENIKHQLAGGEWNRQTLWQQWLEAYTQLLGVSSDYLEHCYRLRQTLQRHVNWPLRDRLCRNRDDSPDQILYATLPSPGRSKLLLELSRREGLVLIAFDKTNLPKETLPFVLSPAEAKGLDFHSVCVVNGGSLRRIVLLLDLISFLHSDSLSFLGRKTSQRRLRLQVWEPLTFYELTGILSCEIAGSLVARSAPASIIVRRDRFSFFIVFHRLSSNPSALRRIERSD